MASSAGASNEPLSPVTGVNDALPVACHEAGLDGGAAQYARRRPDFCPMPPMHESIGRESRWRSPSAVGRSQCSSADERRVGRPRRWDRDAINPSRSGEMPTVKPMSRSRCQRQPRAWRSEPGGKGGEPANFVEEAKFQIARACRDVQVGATGCAEDGSRRRNYADCGTLTHGGDARKRVGARDTARKPQVGQLLPEFSVVKLDQRPAIGRVASFPTLHCPHGRSAWHYPAALCSPLFRNAEPVSSKRSVLVCSSFRLKHRH